MIKPNRIVRSGCLLLLCAAVTIFPPSLLAGYRLGWNAETGKVSLHAEGADLRSVLRHMSEQAGFRLWVSERLQSQPIDIDLQAQSLSQALRRILSPYSYALSLDDDSGVSAVYVLPPGTDAPQSARLEPGKEQQQLMERVLASKKLSDQVKSAILLQSMTHDEVRKTRIRQQSGEVMTRLLEEIEKQGSLRPETLEKLRAHLKRKTDRSEAIEATPMADKPGG